MKPYKVIATAGCSDSVGRGYFHPIPSYPGNEEMTRITRGRSGRTNPETKEEREWRKASEELEAKAEVRRNKRNMLYKLNPWFVEDEGVIDLITKDEWAIIREGIKHLPKPAEPDRSYSVIKWAQKHPVISITVTVAWLAFWIFLVF